MESPLQIQAQTARKMQGVHMVRSAMALPPQETQTPRRTSSPVSPVKQHRGPTRSDTTRPLRRSVQEQDRVFEWPWHGQREHEVGQWMSSWWSRCGRQESERHETHEYSKQRRANPERTCEVEAIIIKNRRSIDVERAPRRRFHAMLEVSWATKQRQTKR